MMAPCIKALWSAGQSSGVLKTESTGSTGIGQQIECGGKERKQK